MFFRRSAALKYFVATILGAAFYCEWAVYRIQPFYWQQLECPAYDYTCTKILFIADPQIQGDDAVPPPLSYLFNWDSDKYLKSTFSVVLKHFKPDVLVYMGDLMDEGSISTMAQFHAYVLRLANIFNIDYPVVQIWIPGDNDIGGENEPIKRDKVAEFDKIFDQESIIMFRNISFYKVNAITHKFQKGRDKSHNFKIVISHYPVTSRHAFGEMINNVIRPNIYFCAHEHESKYVMQNPQLTFRETFPLKYGDKVLGISFSSNSVDDTIYEIYVPTCSYRMGTSKIGYGAAVLQKHNKHMKYTVFWSPQRFPYLFFYLVILIVLVTYFCIFCTAKIFYRHTKPVAKSEEKVPFLERI
ncbi:uncharacterized protein LOC126374334 [Pectinophora gossypiella]|uniref:uncharacterized protein LOC126374334 n=1 Tax=Pectinophora gossypiella TaxID=13191 RepID=UPI00214F4F8E|nr:uncharacterized protein LOC126374334 [Pectinophora gossypiella]